MPVEDGEGTCVLAIHVCTSRGVMIWLYGYFNL